MVSEVNSAFKRQLIIHVCISLDFILEDIHIFTKKLYQVVADGNKVAEIKRYLPGSTSIILCLQ
jgi:hypothetical protein